ncbi:hypothetical protein GCM10017667_28520 [Streptomyces filamentosus]|uniref:DUF4232 domain-containing protein n=1 Tax=Streptomyces filamentosus TaxID=67294 RepID=A0A919BL95_STRFL|nr:hypothetical protein GCM10017667_28520 [Streptomyces filamentosus]
MGVRRGDFRSPRGEFRSAADPIMDVIIGKTWGLGRRVGRELDRISRKVRVVGSLRNPVGPLPSTIYWRRRAVALCLIALLGLLTLWAVTSGDGGGKKSNDAANGASPAPSITPGPGGTGPAISQQPGGRDESGGSGDSGTGDGSGPGSGSGADPGSGSGSASGTDTGSGADPGSGDGSGDGSGTAGKNGDTDGAGGDGGAGSGAGQRVPAGSQLPDCPVNALELKLESVKLEYEPGEKPRFHLVVKNTSGADCKADLGPRAAVLKISDPQNERLWASDDCPRPGDPVLLKVPAHSTITHTVEWDRRRSAPRCATAPAGEAAPGNYLLEASLPGAKVLAAPFTLAKD